MSNLGEQEPNLKYREKGVFCEAQMVDGYGLKCTGMQKSLKERTLQATSPPLSFHKLPSYLSSTLNQFPTQEHQHTRDTLSTFPQQP